ncbi:YdcF family protein [Filobacillus milosensis]|uniref:YdcF family protein n=1 Tax=Filobacillus milosensis TaxID=94137 RepID=A0A4Y8IKU8_9BACI|nr:YdcF family protein [Filobacillus milosensis]TFB21766.1 YdcF family protein [Filobacillus milosensis]
MKKYFLMIIALLMLFFITHTTIIVIDGLNDEVENVDVAVVLGNRVNLNGEPSDRLAARLDKAISLYNEDYFDQIIVSGGIGKEGFDEAKVMKDYLVEHNVKKKHVIVDSDGYNTQMTAENTKAIMEEESYGSVMVITQFYHISRTKLAFSKVGIERVYGAHADFFELRDFYSTIREFPAYYKYLIQ